jgi:exodeoxyribonuclease X
MIFAVTDVETTGIEQADEVCEIAVVRSITGKSQQLHHSTIRPKVAMSLAARATHHITDEELKESPSIEEWLQNCAWLWQGGAVFVAHNAIFDRQMLIQSGVPADLLPRRTICTWRASLHLWPTAEKHSLQYLRYLRNLHIPGLNSNLMAHRAAYDACVTVELLLNMLQCTTVDKLMEWSDPDVPVLLHKLTFGRHYGIPYEQLAKDDPTYLVWMMGQEFDKDIRHTCTHWLRKIGRIR